ncbi:MAG TPA: cardiolipin synthase [Spongiibacteraceae bacterium]|nr:cardiolipin synthase [Spongiibacteraceae bacterium]
MLDALKHWLSELDLAAIAIFTLAVQLLAIIAAMEAILKTRTAQGALAWALSLLLMPSVMLPMYWIFGRRKFRGYAKAKRFGKHAIQVPRDALNEAAPRQLEPYQTTLEKIAQMPFTSGNNCTLLIDGEQTFKALFNAIDNAQHYILLQFYIVRDDDLGNKLADHLLATVQHGVAVYFLYDEIGSIKLGRDYIDRLRDGGIDIRSFNSTKGPRNRLQLNFRNHRKIVVTDGTRAITGGHNVGDEYIDKHPRLTPWRDTSMQIEGPAALALQQTFLEDWYWACEQVPTLRWQTPHIRGDVEALVVPSGPADPIETCLLLFQQLSQIAKHRLWIVSPYFIPDTSIINSLQLAALRGVDVRILLPEKPDKRTVWLSSFASLDEVQRTGIKVYRYEAGFLHQKVWLIDDDCALVGTANLDNRSFRLNFEVNVIAHNRQFASQIEAMLDNDFASSRLLPRGELAARSLMFRLAVRCAYLLAPIL